VTGARPAASILVVDDDEGLSILMAEALRAEGYDAATANSGAEALSWLEQNTPDLLLLDLKMKDVGGQALVERLRRNRISVPFVVVTGQGDEKVAVEVMKQGALDYVMKTTGLIDLLPGAVHRALEAIERDRALAAAQAGLRESEARFAAAVRATNDGVWEWRIPDGQVYFSPQWKAILGYQPAEIPDELAEWRRRVHPEDESRLDRAFREFFDSKGDVFSIEYRLRHKDDSYRWVLSRAVLERDVHGKARRMIGANADVTEKKRLERALLSVSDREQRRIGQDLHDGLGQQLTAIELMCQSLKSDLQAAAPELLEHVSKMSAFLREAVTQTRALAHGLTAFMLDASGLQAALAELTERTSAMSRVKCRFVCPMPVPIDDSETAGHLYRIAQEAVGNALRHGDATEIVVTLERTDGAVVVKVADNGRGLGKGKKPGTGIGLQVMRHRADTIGAELTVESKRGKGVTVICTLRRDR
jgi:PAS domain S-box-containing protein